jgi:hypothetical protein
MVVRLVFSLVALLAFAPSLARAEMIYLNCSGTMYIPEFSSVPGPTNGSITIDFDKQFISGMAGVGGSIMEVTQDRIRFAGSFPRSATYDVKDNGIPIYITGEINRVTGKLAAYHSRSKYSIGPDMRDYLYYDLNCVRVNRQF